MPSQRALRLDLERGRPRAVGVREGSLGSRLQREPAPDVLLDAGPQLGDVTRWIELIGADLDADLFPSRRPWLGRRQAFRLVLAKEALEQPAVPLFVVQDAITMSCVTKSFPSVN